LHAAKWYSNVNVQCYCLPSVPSTTQDVRTQGTAEASQAIRPVPFPLRRAPTLSVVGQR